MTVDTTIIIAVIAAGIAILVLGFLLRRRAPRVERRTGEPYVASRDRPYMKPPAGEVADEVATATTDVACEVLGVEVGRGPAGTDDLQQLKGVGPKFVARLAELGITRFEQLAGLNANEVAHLDERLGAFQGRLVRDRVVEQAHYLARRDTDGFEAKFGKLGG